MPIHATVKGGVVTITGSAQSRQEQQLAERIADGVRGVRLTQNELTRRADAKRDDGTVSNDVKSRLAWDVLVEHDPITATVKDAQVTLAGTVGSAAEKSRAVSDAWVDGVAKVDATALDVKWWDRPDKNLCPFTAKSDQDIATAIKDAAYYDPRVKSFNIKSQCVAWSRDADWDGGHDESENGGRSVGAEHGRRDDGRQLASRSLSRARYGPHARDPCEGRTDLRPHRGSS
jgi:osmotically-inducible protein OsmY